MSNPKIDLIVTGHAPLVDYLRAEGLVADDVVVVQHATREDVTGRHVFGTLPAHLMALTASFTEIPFRFTPADREAMRRGDIPVERLREVAAEPVCYYPPRPWAERPWPVVRCFAAAARYAAPWSTFSVSAFAQGVLELVSAEEQDWAQVDLYRDRYRTRSMGGSWSPWLDENGQQHRDQSDPCALGRRVWLDGTSTTLNDAITGDEVEIWSTGDFLSDAPERYRAIGVERHDGKPDEMRLRPLGINGHHAERLLPLSTPARVVETKEARLERREAEHLAKMREVYGG